MSFQATIIKRFQLNPAHAEHCVRCFDTTASMNFWIWDPNENPDKPYEGDDTPTKKFAHLLLMPTPRQRKESLEVQCGVEKERTFLSVDGCLIKQQGERCEGLLFQNEQLTPNLLWIELKMNAKRDNPNPKTLEDRVVGKAVDQIVNTIAVFKEKGTITDSQSNKAHIAIPKELVALYAKSQAIQALFVKNRKIVKISAGNILKIND
ncbi:MAG: hypothetical protein R2830_14690 [Saprospiraceae bacterium]